MKVLLLLAALLLPATDGVAQVVPDTLALRAAAPDSFTVRFSTTRGDFDVIARRVWSPRGVDRFYHLVSHAYFTDVPFYRVIRGRIAQFGMTTDHDVNAAWAPRPIPDETVLQSNTRGRLHIARSGPDTRVADFVVNLSDNAYLDTVVVQGVAGFPPVAEVISGMAVVDSLYAAYGQIGGEHYDSIFTHGHAYTSRAFPFMDRVLSATPTASWPAPDTAQLGEATYYADAFNGRPTASGVVFDNSAMFAAHRTLPFGTIVRVTNIANNRSVVVEVVDRGPHGSSERARETIIDLSRTAAAQLDFVRAGRARVRVEVLGMRAN